MHKFLFEAPKNICRHDLLPTGKSKRGFSYGTLFARLKAKEIRLSKRNQIKK